jgi:transmembrane sensor
MDKNLLAALAQKYLDGTATESEKRLLNEWYDAADENSQFVPTEELPVPIAEIKNRVLDRLMSSVSKDLQAEKMEASGDTSRGRFSNSITFKWLAAASVVIILFASVRYFTHSSVEKKQVAQVVNKVRPPETSVVPGGNKATLVTGSGQVVILEDIANGVIKNENGLQITKQNGQLIFKAQKQKEVSSPVYNTVYTPRGGQYQILLPDGSRVWLNAASSLKFPGTFSGSAREVELTGEGYFEIAKNPAMPFRVTVNDMKVEVLGTHFNIMSYADEAVVKTTLLEGSVKIIKGSSASLLTPGQQASLNKSADKMDISSVDVDQAVAWKNGLFLFDGETLESVMKQLSRWYNVEVLYKGKFNDTHFRGMISRSVQLEQVIKMLELTSELHFKIEAKTITAMP